jgi:hypothetical protein
VLRWLDDHSTDEATRGFVTWYPFDHPQLGSVELGGWNELYSWTNPPPDRLLAEVDGHADFAVAQALAAPCVEIRLARAEPVGDGTWRVVIGVANTGWLPTTVSSKARQDDLVRPILAEIEIDGGGDVLDGAARRSLGQLAGSSSARFTGSTGSTPDRTSCSWLVSAAPGTTITVTVRHQRAGSDSVRLALGQ